MLQRIRLLLNIRSTPHPTAVHLEDFTVDIAGRVAREKVAFRTYGPALRDVAGAIRWFAGFGWEGQGDIKTADEWSTYLEKFAAKYLASPYAEPEIKVHELPVPQS